MKLKEHLKANTKLAIPVVMTQLGQVSVNVVDIIMIARLGEKQVASANLATSVFIIFFVFLLGFSFSMSPLISSAAARGNKERVARVFTHGMILNVSLGVIIITMLYLAAPLLYHAGQNDVSTIPDAISFLQICSFGLLPLMVFQSYRQFSEGISMTILVTIATITANVVNIILNYILIYGKLGFPAMGVPGSATATLISRILMMLIIIVVLHTNSKSSVYLKLVEWKNFSKTMFKKLVSLGLPSSFQSLFEISAFAAAALIAGMYSGIHIAAHSVTANLASTTFQVCMGFSIAATVRVGNFYGLKQKENMRKAGFASIFVVAGFMTLCAVIFILLRNYLPLIYFTSDRIEVIKVASGLIIIASFFQIFDGIQVSSLGGLRGMRDVKIPTFICFIAYWIIAIPLGYFLCIKQEMGASGMWIGLCSGLIFAAISLLIRFNIMTKVKV